MEGGEPVGVERSLDVPLEHSQPDPVRRVGGNPLEQRCLPGAGRAHQIHDGDLVAVEVFAVGASDGVVGVERILDDPYLGSVHGAPLHRLDL